MQPIKRLPVTRLQEINQAYRDRLIDFNTAESMFMNALGVDDPEDRFLRIKVAFKIHPDAFRKGKITQKVYRNGMEIDTSSWFDYEIDPDEVFYTYIQVSPYVYEHPMRLDRASMFDQDPGDYSEFDESSSSAFDEGPVSMFSSSSDYPYEDQTEIKIGTFIEGDGNIHSLTNPGNFIGTSDENEEKYLSIHYDVNWLSEVEAPGAPNDLYSGVARRRRSRSPIHRRSPRASYRSISRRSPRASYRFISRRPPVY